MNYDEWARKKYNLAPAKTTVRSSPPVQAKEPVNILAQYLNPLAKQKPLLDAQKRQETREKQAKQAAISTRSTLDQMNTPYFGGADSMAKQSRAAEMGKLEEMRIDHANATLPEYTAARDAEQDALGRLMSVDPSDPRSAEYAAAYAKAQQASQSAYKNVGAVDDAIHGLKVEDFEAERAARKSKYESSALAAISRSMLPAVIDTSSGRGQDGRIIAKLILDPETQEGIYRGAEGDTVSGGRFAHLVKYLSVRERNTAYTLIEREDWDGLSDYMDALERDLTARNAQQSAQEQQAWAKAHPGLALGASIASSPLQGMGFLANAGQLLQNTVTGEFTPTDPNSRAFSANRYSQNLMQGATEDMGAFGQFMYQTAASAGNMAMLIPLGPLALPILGSEAAGQTTYGALQRGASPSQAFRLGLISGAVEMLTERIPLNTIMKVFEAGSAATVRELIKEVAKGMGKSAGEEAIQEFISEYAGNLTDEAIMGTKSERSLAVASYMAQGMTEENAARKVFMDMYVVSPLLSAAGGALSGGALAGIGGAFSGLNYASQNRAQTPPTTSDVSSQGVIAPQATVDTPAQQNAVQGDLVGVDAAPASNPLSSMAPLPAESVEATNPLSQYITPKKNESAAQQDVARATKQAAGNMKDTLIDLFSVPNGARRDAQRALDAMATDLFSDNANFGEIMERTFDQLYGSGKMQMPIGDGYAETAATQLKGKRIYVPQSVRAEFTDAWDSVRRQAFSRGVYFTSDPSVMGLDSAHAELAGSFPGLFDARETDPAKMVNDILNVLDQSKKQTLSLEDGARRLWGEDAVTEHRNELMRGFFNAVSDFYNRVSATMPGRANATADGLGAALAGFAGTKEMGFSQNIRTDQNMDAGVRAEVEADWMMYNTLTNEETLGKAESIYAQGFDAAFATLNTALTNSENGMKLSPEMVPLSRMVANEMGRNGDEAGARTILERVSLELLASGQLGQAAFILRNADPASVDATVQRALDEINDNLRGSKRRQKKAEKAQREAARTGADAPTVKGWQAELTDAEIQQLWDTDFSQEGAFEAFYTQVMKRIGSEMPSTLWEKISEVRRISMLMNPKTQIKNVVANVPLQGMRKVSERLSGAIQSTLVKMGAMDVSEQTRTARVSKESKQIAAELYANHKAALFESANKWDMNTMLREYRTFFSGTMNTNNPLTKMLNKTGEGVDAMRAFTYKMLELGDSPFVKSAFIDSLAQYVQAQGFTDAQTVPQSAMDYAAQQAMEATFKDVSRLAQLINEVKRNGGLGGAALDIIIPFTTTPINIAKRTYEYSPLGFIKFAADLSKGKDVAVIVDDFSRALTGTGVVALGFLLKKMGIITGKGDDDKDKRAWDRATGKSPYSINGRWDYSWMQPVGSLLAIGAEIWDSVEDNEGAIETILGTTFAAGDAFLNMSFFQTFLDLLNGYGSPTENILTEVLTSGASQIAPSVFGAFARTADDTVRTSYTGKNVFSDTLAQVKAKTPGASTTLPASVNVKGEESKRASNPLLRAAQEFINPGNINIGTMNEVDKTIETLYDDTGDKTIFPRVAPNKLQSGKYVLTGEERALYQTISGQTYYDMVQELSESPAYASMSNTEKITAIQNILSVASDKANRAVIEGRGEEYSPQASAATKAQEFDAGEVAYILYKNAWDSLNDSKGDDKAAFEAMYDQYVGMPAEQKESIKSTLGDGTRFDDILDAKEAGISTEAWYDAYDEWSRLNAESGKAQGKSTEFSHWLGSQNLTTPQERILKEQMGFGNYLSTDDKWYDSLKGAGLSNDTAKAVYDKMASISGDDAGADRLKRAAIATMPGLTNGEKYDVAKLYFKQSAAKYTTAQQAKIPYATYARFVNETSQMSADKDKNGKSISGSKQKKVFTYINGLSLSRTQKDALALLSGNAESSLKKAPWN